jgi:hypothetical protein
VSNFAQIRICPSAKILGGAGALWDVAGKTKEYGQMYKQYFEPRELTVLAAVLHRACLDMGVVDNGQREVIAARIIRLAQTGKWDFNMPEKGPTISDFRHFFESLRTRSWVRDGFFNGSQSCLSFGTA